MRIKLDENLPIELVAQLGAQGHDVEDVYGEQLSGQPDPEVWRAAQNEKRLLITQDIGFGDARMFTPRPTRRVRTGSVEEARARRADGESSQRLCF